MQSVSRSSPVAAATGVLAALRRVPFPAVAFVAILAVALGLRLYGLDWDRGFSYTPHPDERAILQRIDNISPPALGDLGVLLDAEESPWNPRWFPYGSFPLYMLKGVQLIYLLGPADELSDLRIPGRAISALADVVTVAMVFLLGSRLYGRRTGLLASALVALAVIHIQLSHFFAVDTFLALFSIVAFFFTYRVARTGRLRDSVLAGAFIGLGLATKVSLAPIYGAFVFAHIMYAASALGNAEARALPFDERWRSALKGLGAGVAASLVVFFVVQPYAFLDWDRFYGDVIEQSEMVRRIRDYPYTRQYIDTTPYWYQVRQLATWGLGWPLGLVAWAGLLYASFRGMRWEYGLAYLVVGWAAPMGVLLVSAGFLSIFVASVTALAALLGTLPFRSRDSRTDALILSWVVPYFLISGAFDVKFMRYLIPITPFLVLLGSRMLFATWESATVSRPSVRPWLVAGGVLLVGGTAFYALAYTAVYKQPHTAVRASEWIIDNAPMGSVIVKEHWEEGLPGLDGFQHSGRDLELELYQPDRPEKVRRVAEQLAGADYLVFFSDRLYGTIPRLPERYPLTSRYYELLFSGQLGYELVDFEVTYPELLGVAFVDETFRRPGLPEPEALRQFKPAPLTLNLGFADESFAVYDHPKVLVLENTRRHDSGTLRALLDGGALGLPPPVIESSGQELGLMLSPEDLEAQQRGGTWTEIVSTSGWTTRLPVLAWLVVVEGIALLALPLAFVVFRPLPDRGYLFAKALGLLGVCLVVWLLASLQWMAFSKGAIVVGLLVLSAASAVVIARRRGEIAEFVRRRWPVLVIGEVLFLVAFFAFLAVRMANPDLWHPHRGGEKPMDLAYLNAVLRSTYMPPYDPWFAGGFINYYYWGQFIVATLIRATGIEPAVAFNLAVPTFFALTVAGAFAVVYSLAEGSRRVLGPRADQALAEAAPDRPGPGEGPAGRFGLHWSPVVAGLGGVVFVTVLGNLDGAVQVGRGVWRALVRDAPFGLFDFWSSSRMMPPDPPGHEITEFPFFTFLFADLHAHLMALPFTLLAIGVALAVVTAASASKRIRPGLDWNEMARLAVLGVVVGSLRLLNTWDFPTYLILAVGALLLAEVFGRGGLGLAALVSAGLKSVFVFVVGYVVFLPFNLTNETFFNSLQSTTNTTVLWQFLAIGGLFVFVIGTFFVVESADWLADAWRSVRRAFASLDEAVSEGSDAATGSHHVGVGRVMVITGLALLVAYGVTAVLSGVAGSTIPFVALLLVLVVVAGMRWQMRWQADSPRLIFAALLVGVALSVVIGLDVFRVEGDIDRMNSVFKFYLQVWVMLALASAYLLWRLVYATNASLGGVSWWGKGAWLGFFGVLVAASMVYPVLGTQDRLRDRFNGRVTSLTLDGEAYVDGAVYRDREGDIDLATDYEGIEWLRENVEGSPVVLEGQTPTYRWGGRISISTGLPSIVGWPWHQSQQRWEYRSVVGDRVREVNEAYRTPRIAKALSIMEKYGVSYVYVGQLERLYYPESGLKKFDEAVGSALEKVFDNGVVVIYRLKDTDS